MWFGFETPVCIPVWIPSALAVTSLVFGAVSDPYRGPGLILLCAKDSEFWFGLASRQSSLFHFGGKGFCCLTCRLRIWVSCSSDIKIQNWAGCDFSNKF